MFFPWWHVWRSFLGVQPNFTASIQMRKTELGKNMENAQTFTFHSSHDGKTAFQTKKNTSTPAPKKKTRPTNTSVLHHRPKRGPPPARISLIAHARPVTTASFEQGLEMLRALGGKSGVRALFLFFVFSVQSRKNRISLHKFPLPPTRYGNLPAQKLYPPFSSPRLQRRM